MSAAIDVRPEGMPQLEAVLEQLARRGGNMRPYWDAVGQYLETATDRRFETETDPTGKRWEPSIRAEEEGGKTLTDTARLRQSITHLAASDSVRVGTNVIYAGVHQGGATIRGKNGPLRFQLPGLGIVFAEEVIIPARPFLGVDRDDEEEIVALGEDYLAGAWS